MQNYMVEEAKKDKFLENYGVNLTKREAQNYKENAINYPIIKELQSAPSRVSELENKIYLMKDCGSCPSCACINQDVQFLAVIEAPATVPLLIMVGGIRIAT